MFTSPSSSPSNRKGGGGQGGGRSVGLSSFPSNKKGKSYKAKYHRFGFIITALIVSVICVIIVFHNNNNRDNDLYSSSSNYVVSQEKEKDFKSIATKTGTDKVVGYALLPECISDTSGKHCAFPNAEREECRPWGHFYDTIYNRYLGKYTLESSKPIQFLEIGFYEGKGFEAYTKFLDDDGGGGANLKHELHSMEISCIEHGPRAEGKWPWANAAEKNPGYSDLLKNNRLHCGDASQYSFLKSIWDNKMKRNSNSDSNLNSNSPSTTDDQKRSPSPPLMVVVDDGSHQTEQMTTSLFFWIPRIEPGGILIMEDIQPIVQANKFRTHILPQVMKDIHWCGGEITGSSSGKKDEACFPRIQSFIHSIHCEMHICVFIRNSKPSEEPSEEDSIMPKNALNDDTVKECLFGGSA
jgi:hypothetical protein